MTERSNLKDLHTALGRYLELTETISQLEQQLADALQEKTAIEEQYPMLFGRTEGRKGETKPKPVIVPRVQEPGPESGTESDIESETISDSGDRELMDMSYFSYVGENYIDTQEELREWKPSTLRKYRNSWNLFVEVCRKFYEDTPIDISELQQDIEEVLQFGLEHGYSENEIRAQGTLVRDVLHSLNPDNDFLSEMHRIIGLARAKKFNPRSIEPQPLPHGAVSFGEIVRRRDALDPSDPDHLLLSLFCDPNMPVLRPSEYASCVVGRGEPSLPRPADCPNYIDLDNGLYYRFRSKGYSDLELPKLIFPLPQSILNAIRQSRTSGQRLTDGKTSEYIRNRLKALVPGCFINPQFLRRLWICTYCRPLTGAKRLDMCQLLDHDPETQMLFYDIYA